MNTDTYPKPSTNPLQNAATQVGERASDVSKDMSKVASDTFRTLSAKAGEGAERTKEYVQHAVDVTKDAAHRASDSAKDLYQSASAKAEDAIAGSKEYAHQNPFPVALGALITGLALGYAIGLAHREEPSFRQRLFS
jgi:ElaB/YqjD/DUF883 family membrane-anchored ribosome-binding protein